MHVITPIVLVLLLAFTTNGHDLANAQDIAASDISQTLPHDPGPAGKKTLEGIDSDNDGVRDDVQRWIALTYPSSEKTRTAVIQMAKAMQLILLNAADEANARTNSIAADKAADCISFVREQILGRDSDAYNLKRELEAIYLNTSVRSRAWLQADSFLSGMFFNVPSDLSTGCDFNPNAMPN